MQWLSWEFLDKQLLLLGRCRLSYDFAEVSLGFPVFVNATLVEFDGGLSRSILREKLDPCD
ncbi:hypothetical protein EMIT0P218_20070 [Pseudomonas sp. IT-P218]